MTGFLCQAIHAIIQKLLYLANLLPKLAQQKKMWICFMLNSFLMITDFVLEIRAGC